MLNAKIKVTVTYTEPEQSSKIDALLKEYEAAAKVASETKEELTPIIDGVGLAKYDAICEEIMKIGNKVKAYCKLKHSTNSDVRQVEIYTMYHHPGCDMRKFIVGYNIGTDKIYCAFCCSGWENHGYDFFKGREYMKDKALSGYRLLFDDKGIVARWNQLNIIDDLKAGLESTIRSGIKDQMYIKKHYETTLESYIKD